VGVLTALIGVPVFLFLLTRSPRGAAMTALPPAISTSTSARCASADGLGFDLAAGERLAILGRNGTGKTTLLHTLAGLRAPDAGSMRLAAPPTRTGRAGRAASLRGLLPQGHLDAFQSTVLETALIGRHPHLGRWDWEGKATSASRARRWRRWTSPACEPRGAHPLRRRAPAPGHRRAAGAAAALYLLDEPLAHLDLNHQIAVLELLSRRARGDGVGIVMVLHDINLALRHADRALLLFGEGRTLEGPVAEVLTAESLSRLYGHPLREMRDDGARYFVPA
jgi:iron complex transport system ATP-binding protein